MPLPESLLESLKEVKGFEKETFERVHQSGEQVTSIRINPNKVSMVNGQWSIIHYSPFTLHQQVPWSDFGYYLASRPSFTFDPLFHAGCYYVQEASSMFLEQAIQQTIDQTQPLKVLDLCAAPGGKTTHLQSLLSEESLLVSNEVIRHRTSILKDNIIKWGAPNAVVTSNDPVQFQRLPSFFDVMVVDAPCSGSGLFRRDEAAINEWSLNNVALCHQRQQRILADALPALKENGILIYSTCSYSKEEDEDIADWLVTDQNMESVQLSIEKYSGIIESASFRMGAYGYRFFPDKVRGEGFYLGCFRKKSGTAAAKNKGVKMEKATAQEKAIIQPWVNGEALAFLKRNQSFFIFPEHLLNDLALLQATFYLAYAGVEIGEIMKNKFVPAHALAVSSLLSTGIASLELPYEEAIKYLQRAELKIETGAKGWLAVNYKKHNLGWINALSNRLNNYYPKELRILKQQNGVKKL